MFKPKPQFETASGTYIFLDGNSISIISDANGVEIRVLRVPPTNADQTELWLTSCEATAVLTMLCAVHTKPKKFRLRKK